MHAQMMPVLASMTDQIVAGMGPNVGSGSLADAAIVVALNMDENVTLPVVSPESASHTVVYSQDASSKY